MLLLPQKNHGAFTLVELIVVIAIITILIAVLLPALAAARKAAQSIQCLSNQRQVFLSVMTYSQDHDHYYPTDLNDGATDWMVLITPYLDNRFHPTQSRKQTRQILHDPAMPAPEQWKWWYTNYAIHLTLLQHVRISYLRHPSDVLLMSDYYPLGWRENRPTQVTGQYAKPDSIPNVFRHSNSMNLVYADGHGGSLKNVEGQYPQTLPVGFKTDSKWKDPKYLPVFPAPFGDK